MEQGLHLEREGYRMVNPPLQLKLELVELALLVP